MRRILLYSIISILLSGMFYINKASAQPGPDISVSDFYDQLSPYGRWIDNPQYGRVWLPQVDAGFVPYSTNGRWISTEYGNTWASDYDWGWAPFHYGRWTYDNYYGWMWIPGSEWAPAWVSWRSGGGYYGWAPLGPGMGINVSINIPILRWIFVPQRYIMQPRISLYSVAPRRNINFFNRTTIINNIYVNNNRRFFSGPGVRDMERHTGRRINTQRVDFKVPNRGRDNDYRYGYNSRPDSRPDSRPRNLYDYRTRPTRDAGNRQNGLSASERDGRHGNNPYDYRNRQKDADIPQNGERPNTGTGNWNRNENGSGNDHYQRRQNQDRFRPTPSVRDEVRRGQIINPGADNSTGNGNAPTNRTDRPNEARWRNNSNRQPSADRSQEYNNYNRRQQRPQQSRDAVHYVNNAAVDNQNKQWNGSSRSDYRSREQRATPVLGGQRENRNGRPERGTRNR